MFHYRKSFSAEPSLRELAFEIEYRLGVSIRDLNPWLTGPALTSDTPLSRSLGKRPRVYG